MLPAGATVPLTLQHHVTASRTPAGTPVYFRVARDVVVDGHVVIRAGTLVTGTMLDAASRDTSGRSGSIILGVRSVPGIDGAMVPVEADLARQATIAPGVHTYLERATTIDTTVLTGVSIDPERAEPLPAADPMAAYPLPLSVIESDFADSWTDPYRLHIERGGSLNICGNVPEAAWDRLVANSYVTATATSEDSVRYELTDAGRTFLGPMRRRASGK
jgi:hypothetical protein